ncbi:pollen-specific leucine-rich repeat extensin-like protein 1 isoform X2 [Asterias rubens]|uniref:pollen-specific leucine-rich repeat extensin-like protein 1 isoform X2 n=1 Tax=Asterias rubens TaxID=7604 RepID=UPI0014557B8A|nr:pollen-specific leucine-rich repeat extensin-like protein 1 isoform X2 [Asterias rubens]
MARNAATFDDALYWTVKEVGDWLERIGFYEYKEPLQTVGINGKELFELSENKLRRLHPTRNMPTGRSDPASMLWKQINKVKENRRPDRKKTKNPFSGSRWGASEKRPPQAPEPDYNQPPPSPGRRDDGSEEENCWGSDFSNDEDEFEQAEDNPALLQGNTQGRTVSYNGSSTSSFTNLSSSASGKEDDSSLYLAPNTDEDFDQTYEVPSEQMNSSYGDDAGDEIYDVPHDEEENNHQAFQKRHPGGGRSVSPLPQVIAPRPLPCPPPHLQAPWQQQQQQHPSQMLDLPGRISPRPPLSPRHYKRAPEISQKEEIEQENYEVPSLEEPEQSEYEAPMMEQQEEEEEEEYLVADTTRGFKTRRLPELPQNDSVGFPSRPPAPLPSSGGGPPPRPVKPPDLHFSSSDEALPPPIPVRPPASRSPVETKAFTTKVLPDPPPQTIRNIVKRTSGDLAFGINTNNGLLEERRGLSQPPPPLAVSTMKPPPLPKNIPETPNGSRDLLNTAANNGDGIAKMLNKFERKDEPEIKPPQLTPRPLLKKPDPASKPTPTRKPWQKSIHAPPQEVNLPLSTPTRHTLASADNRAGQPPKLPLPQPSPRSHLPDPADIERNSVKPMPQIPGKDLHKPIKKFTPHSPKAHPEIPKKSEAMEEKVPLRREPEKAPLRREPEKAIRQVPMVPKMSDMTGYPWYDAKLSRGEADRILKETKKDGAFVVRNSARPDQTTPYSLSLWFNNKSRNLHIRLRSDGKYALGKFKENEQVFDTPVLLIQYHMTTPLILAGDEGKTCLKIAAPNFR